MLVTLINRRSRGLAASAALACALLLCLGASARAQSPNTASIIVIVTDQTGAAVSNANVATADDQGTVSRSGVSNDNGSATIPALPPGARYTLTISKRDFAQQKAANIEPRAGETVVVRVKLTASAGASEVTVYGTARGVRNDPELGTRLDARQIDDVPLLGRKISYLPLLNAAFRQAKGTGDLFLNSIYVVTGAGGRRQADYIVDGASGDEPWGRQTMFLTLPVSAVEEMNVMSRAFSAEFGWTSSTAINVVTKSGTNAMHGEALFLGRPGGAQSDRLSVDQQCPSSISSCKPPTSNGNPVAIVPPDIPDSLAQGSFSIGGPLLQNQAQFFVAVDGTRQRRTAPITSPLVPAGTTIVGRYGQALANGRVDYKANDRHSLMGRLNLDRFYDTNPQDAVSGNVLPSAGRKFARHSWGAQVNGTSILFSSMVNEARLDVQQADPVTSFDPLTPSTQFTRAGAMPYTSGESRFVHVFSKSTQISDTLTWTRDAHYIRMGGSLTRSTSGGDGTEFGSAFVLGQYTVNASTTAAPDQLTLTDMQRYQQSFNFGISSYERAQWIGTLFVQDNYRLRPDITLDLGLRYDRQSFSDGTKNVAPRVGFGWNPQGDPKTVVRGGYGLYYTMLRANTDASFTLGGPTGIFTYQATPGQTGFPSCLTCTPVPFDQHAALNTLPARNITIRPGDAAYYAQFFDIAKLPGYASATFVNPKSRVMSIGVERELRPALFLAVDYVKQHWTDLDRTIDLNAPSLFARTAPGQVRTAAAADLTRPILPTNGGYRQINVVENLGVADYDGLQTMLRWQDRRATASISYTLSKATNTTEPDGNGAGQNDFNQLGEEERGPSLLDQRHRAVITFSYRLPYAITAGTVMQFASARAFNPTTGVDNNGDGNNNDRPAIDGAIAGRYSFRGTPTSEVALFAEGGYALAGGRRVSLRAEVFNLFNHANILGRNGTYGDTGTPLATFGQANAGLANVDPGRMLQIEIKFSF
jgi:hypothetical protein